MTTRKGLFIFCIQIIVVLTKYTAGFQNETTDDYITTTNSNDTTEFVWESMDLDDRDCWKCECPSLCYYDGTSVVYKPNMLEYSFGFTTRINVIFESVARYLINEEFKHPYSLLTYEFVWESMNLDEFQNFLCYAIYESETGYFIFQVFEHPYSCLINDCLTATNSIVKCTLQSIIYDDYLIATISNYTTEFVWESMDLDDRDCWKCECPSLCYYDGTSVVYKPNMLEYSFGFTTRINDCSHRLHRRDILYLLNEDLSERKVCRFKDVSRKNWFEIINESEAGYFIYEEFEHPYSWLTFIYESEAGYLINEEFEHPYSWFTYCNHRVHWRDIYLLKEYLSERKVSGFEDVSRKTWFGIIYNSEAGYLINEEFEHPYSWLTYWKDIYLLKEYPSERKVSEFEDVSRKTWFDNCSPEIYEPKMLEYKVAFTTRFIEDGPLSWIQLEICDTKELNYQTSMESLHGIESTALLATFILTVLSMRIVSEEQLIKDTVSHSLIVKTTTKEARQNLPTKAEEEAVRHCELCINHDQAIAYCMTCKLYICMPCNGLHKRVWTLMNHTVCPFNHM